ncbi:hypothetical protein CYY_002055 [Polysphondylium violaceum]|uniref:Uncharacterized protein n=1 Tax=Polysphondylium violaceum TaxID=133409 RepID=A0A8J4PZ21_9MYCE|nr:hypothetical protein CYY_002055 [Polysphondylium violaceum]
MLSRGLAKGIRYYTTSTFQETPRVVESSTLANGLKVVSMTGGYSGPAVSLGLYIKSGSRNECHNSAGVNQVLKNLVFQSNSKKLYLEVQREIETMGSTAFTQASRDSLLISTQTLPVTSQFMLQHLANVTKPTLPYHEVRDSAAVVADESEAYNHDIYTTLFDSLHQAAFRGKTLGRPLVAPRCNISNLTQEAVTEFADKAYTPSNMVLVSVGVNHKELVEEAGKLDFGRTKSSAALTSEPAKYIGGESIKYNAGNSHVILGFEGAAHSNVRDVAALSVLQNILGAGCAKLAPGNGVTSRLNQIVTNNPSVVSAEAFNLTYGDAGLFGVYFETESNVAKVLSLLTSEIVAASNVSGQELEKAKTITRSHIFEQTETRSNALEFIGKQAVYQVENILTPSQFAQEVAKVTAEDVKRVAKKMTSSKPTLVVSGDNSEVPTLESLQSALKL